MRHVFGVVVVVVRPGGSLNKVAVAMLLAGVVEGRVEAVEGV